MDSPNIELLSSFATLYGHGKYSDLTIQSGQKKFSVHKAIICSRSVFFDGACSHPFRESTTGVIDLSEDDAEAVEHMVHYFYHLDYLTRVPGLRRTSSPASRGVPRLRIPTRQPRKLDLGFVEDPLLAQAQAHSAISTAADVPATPLTPPQDRIDYSSPIDTKIPMSPAAESYSDDHSGSDSYESASDDDDYDSATAQPADLVVHAKVYAIAEKYGITGLKSLARQKYATAIRDGWSSPEFADSIQEVYESTIDMDRGLRDLVIQNFREHPQLARSRHIELIVRDTPGIAWELFRLGWGLPVC